MEQRAESDETITSLVALPLEVLAEILSFLDTKTLYDLYESGDYFKNVLHTVSECKFSLNKLATAESFNSNFFMDISRNLRVLNLSGIHDLTLSSLIPALKSLNKLEALDVSYTNIIIPDYLEIAKIRPTLKTLSINFSFPEYEHSYYRTFPKDMMTEYQQAFKTLENVHFVGNADCLLHSQFAICMLDEANVHSLKLTVFENMYSVFYFEGVENFQSTVMERLLHLCIHFTPYYTRDINLYNLEQELPLIASFDLDNYEILTFPSCAATPLLKDICLNLGFHVNSWSIKSYLYVGGGRIMLWKKDETRFDAKFNSKLLGVLEEWMKFEIKYPNLKPVSAQHKWCDIHICTAVLFSDEYDRIVNDVEDLGIPTYMQTVLTLNIDKAIKEKENVKLRLSFWNSTTVGRLMIKKSCALKNITHLSLFGNVNYCSDFFYNMFACCDSLVTLEITQSDGIFSSSYLEFLPKNKVFKNILINVCEIDFFALFTNLSKCRTLENIHLVSTCTPVHTLPSPKDLFINCNNLYNLHVQAVMNDEIRESMLKLYKKVRLKLGKHGINIDIFSHIGSRKGHYPYDNYKDDVHVEIYHSINYPKEFSPYGDIFSVITMKP